VWSSDAYHHDGSDAWSAIRAMNETGVPNEVQAKLLGGNARRMYGIEGKIHITEEAQIVRPDWFPKPEECEAHWQRMAYPRKAGAPRRSGQPAQSGY
jgi:hypothetical protein